MAFRTVLGTCHHDCPDSCGWEVTVDEAGVATSLRGNPAHPYSRGELCPKVNRFLDRVYHPDRILHPLVRVGAKGEGRFERASWDDALALVARRLHEVIDCWGGEAVVPWGSAGTQGLLQHSSLDRRLFARMGASRSIGSLCGLTAGAGTASTLGSGRACDPTDVRHARLVLLWGTNTRLTNRHLWPFVEEARRDGATIVVIDPLRTATARSADWFVQPRPGTDVALMLGMLHVLVRDGHVDHDYVREHTTGFEELAVRVKEWTPERAAAACGVAAEEIERLATAYGTTTPAFIRTLIGAEHRVHGAMLFRTLACLPTVTGQWRHRGGGLARSVGTWADRHVDDSVFEVPSLAGGRARRALSVNHLGRSLTDPSLDPRVMALVVWNGNPLVSAPNAGLIRRGLARDDLFCVVSEQFVTDTARYADVILPATTQIEQTDVVPAWGHLYLGWNEAAIAPLGESVPNTELWRRLAHAMGYTDPELFVDDDTLLRSALHDVDLDALRRDGFVRHDLPEDLRPYAHGGFATPDGRAALWSDALERAGHDALPAYEPPPADARFPFALLTPKQQTRFLNSSYSHAHAGMEPAPAVEVDAADAVTLGVADGDPVRVWNDRGELRLPVRVSDRVRAGVAAVPWGWWAAHHPDGATANELTDDTLADWGGGVAFYDTLVAIERAG
jgi:anaerobic selenocysteine-containing dehydrogenase